MHVLNSSFHLFWWQGSRGTSADPDEAPGPQCCLQAEVSACRFSWSMKPVTSRFGAIISVPPSKIWIFFGWRFLDEFQCGKTAVVPGCSWRCDWSFAVRTFRCPVWMGSEWTGGAFIVQVSHDLSHLVYVCFTPGTPVCRSSRSLALPLQNVSGGYVSPWSLRTQWDAWRKDAVRSIVNWE